MAGYARLQRACLLLCSLAVSNGHTWMFSKGRAWMQASLDAPFRARVTEAGQGTHVQLGPGQTTVLRWASSHNNTFSLAVISAADEEWFYHKDYYKVRALVHIYVVYYVRLVVEGCTSRPLCPSFILSHCSRALRRPSGLAVPSAVLLTLPSPATNTHNRQITSTTPHNPHIRNAHHRPRPGLHPPTHPPNPPTHPPTNKMLDDYIDSAPPGANEAVEKPRYHGAAGNSRYLNTKTNTACAGGRVAELVGEEKGRNAAL